MTSFLTEYSPWYTLLCLLAGAAYAFLLYSQEAPWGKPLNRGLAALRFVVVALLCFLLLGPFVRQVRNYYERPTVVLAVDNSQSLPLVNDSTKLGQVRQQIDQLAEKLRQSNFDVHIQGLDARQKIDNASQIAFNQPTTNLSGLLGGIQANYENRNLAGIVLVSDGIYNQGTSPAYLPLKTGVHVVALGDTLPQSDIAIKATLSNKIAYLGNKFPLVAEVSNAGFAGREAVLSLLQNGQVIERKPLVFKQENGLQQVEFLLNATEKGMQHYVLNIAPLAGEFTERNNVKHVYIDVLDGREKILIVAAAPHPDIKALRSALEKNENNAVSLYIPGLTPEDQWKRNEKYDLLIAHQLPANNALIASNLVRDLATKGTPTWYIVGAGTSLMAFNNAVNTVSINANGLQVDKVTPAFNPAFGKFTFSDENKAAISKYPPVMVPFGNYRLGAGAEVVLYQRVGSLQTEKPLLVVGEDNERKTAVMLGEGLWQWRIQEYARNENWSAFDDLVSKTAQYLSTQDDKRRFRVSTTSGEYFTTESVLFETEVYNDIYEKIYGQKIDLALTDEQGRTTRYTYVNNTDGMRYRVSGLEQGVYRYRATTMLNGKQESATGEFTVKELMLEALSTTADFAMLRQLAKQSGGGFYTPANMAQLGEQLAATKAASLIHSTEEMRELLHLKWLFFLLVLLASAEWLVRKVRGAY